jgi:hypothetical protein
MDRLDGLVNKELNALLAATGTTLTDESASRDSIRKERCPRGARSPLDERAKTACPGAQIVSDLGGIWRRRSATVRSN